MIERENDGSVALCPELDVAGQGDAVEEANSNLREALERDKGPLRLLCIQNKGNGFLNRVPQVRILPGPPNPKN